MLQWRPAGTHGCVSAIAADPGRSIISMMPLAAYRRGSSLGVQKKRSSGRKQGGQPGHPGQHREMVAELQKPVP
jgi:hypothetical protein